MIKYKHGTPIRGRVASSTIAVPSSAILVGSTTVDEDSTAQYTLQVTWTNGKITTDEVSEFTNSNPAAGSITSSGLFTAASVTSNTETTISANLDFIHPSTQVVHSVTGTLVVTVEDLSRKKLWPSVISSSAYFGWSVSVSGDGNTAIVGAPTGSTTGTGTVYIYTRTGSQWTVRQSIAKRYYFGSAVAISKDGTTAIIGAKYEPTTSSSQGGTAYIFTRSGDTWTEQSRLESSDQSYRFGHSVAISGDGNYAMVGSYDSDTAYIYARSGSTWSEQKAMIGGRLEDRFGQSVALNDNGDTAIVGISNMYDGSQFSGGAQVWTRSGSTWSVEDTLFTSDSQYGDEIGISVSISNDGDTVVVGAHYEDTGGKDAGAAYIFTRNRSSWTEQQKIQAGDRQSDDRFGISVSISGDGQTAIVGAHKESAFAPSAGAAYIFTRSGETWTEQKKILPDGIGYQATFGSSVSIGNDGLTTIVGATREWYSDSLRTVGAAYIDME